jgi:acyl transferase domain-containing protein/NAD(P)-dependent dehydrogenase (short-subunit alcohol dehydrogenase family)
MSEPLAIIGISCLFPKADDLQSFWRNIKHGVDAITPIPASHWNVADYFHADPKAPDQTYAQRGGFLSPVAFNPMEFGIAPKDVEATDTTQLLGLIAAKQALADAGYAEKPFNKARTSVILGVTGALELVIPLGARLGHPIWRRALKEAGVAEPVAEDVVQRISDSYVGWQENSFPGLLGNVAAGRIASRLDLGGTNCVVDAACASSMAALHLAALELSAGRSDMVLTGGIDTFNDIFMYMCFSKTPALSPTGDAKPFDRDCDGTILGEGLGMLVLKRLADAERDGDRIYAVLKGLGSSSDGRGNAIYAPRADGQKEALRRAYAEAGTPPETIELIEAHGTGTKVGDATEVESLTEVFRAARPEGTWAALGSVKSQIGHTKAAAGIAGLIKAALALEQKVLPPTIKVSQPTEELAPGRSPFYVNTQRRPWLPRATHPRRAGVSAFGFGGTNFHCVLEEHGAQRIATGWDGDVEILALSSDSRDDLCTQLASLPGEASWAEVRQRAAQSRTAFQSEAKFRLLLPLSQGTALSTPRDAALKMLDQHREKAHWTLPTGVAFGSGPRRGKLGALFPGQGSQYVGMFRDLACQFPGMIEALAAANEVFASERPELGDQRLSDFIYPHAAFSDEVRREQEAALKSTDVAQPALGSVGLGALSVLATFGVTPEAAAGHSYGELLALCGAGRLQPDALHRLSNLRGRLMANRNGHRDRGAMLAVQAPEEIVAGFLGEATSSLVIANRNSPSQFVLAGSKPHIEHAAGELAKRSLRAKVLPVSAAFHSALVADAREPFAAALEDIKFSRGHIPVYANSTAKAYPAGAKQARELLASQIVQPVDFMAQIETMLADGVTTFVECGPGHVLSDLVQAIAQGREVEAIALDSSKGSRSGTLDLAIALCRLAALGHAVELSRWENTPLTTTANGKPGFTIALTGANHRNPRPARPTVVAQISQSAVSQVSQPANPQPAAVGAPNSSSARLAQADTADSRRIGIRRSSEAALPAQPPQESSPVGSSHPATLPADLQSALQTAQQGMIALQQMQEQTAQLHRQFLENQDAARRTLEALLIQRRELLGTQGNPESRIPKAEANPKSEVRRPNPETGHAGSHSSIPTPANRAPAQATATTHSPGEPQQRPVGLRPSDVAAAVLAVVAEKTGYPAEMLNLDMGLDSDLGVDSIKRVEIMAALRGCLPHAPEIKPEHLGSLQTLQQVVDFLSAGDAPRTDPGTHNPAPASRSTLHLSTALLQVVAEKTGYPGEMLNLDMGLDSDLGVDSIKRVEIMAALRTLLPDAPEIKPEHLGTLQTLQQIVDFLSAGAAAPTAPAAAPSSILHSPSSPSVARASTALLQVVAEKTGYPVEMLNLDMGLDSDLGVDSIKRVEIMAALRTLLPDAPEIKPEHLGTLQTLRQISDFLTSTPDTSTAPPPIPSFILHPPSASASPQPLHRQIVKSVRLPDADTRSSLSLPPGARIWVTDDGSDLAPALAAELTTRGFSVRREPAADLLRNPRGEQPVALVILWPAVRGDDAAVKDAFRVIQLAGPSLRAAKGILLTASRLDGTFGFGALNGNGNPISGGLAGLTKTAAREWPEVHCKALDLNPEVGISAADAPRVVEEMFRAGPVEVGLSGESRSVLQVETLALAADRTTPLLQDGDLVLVTGGARGITSAAVLQLARATRLQLVLLGRSPLAGPEPDWLADLTSEADLKRALLARANGSGSPKQIEAQLRDVLAQREMRECLHQLRATGATVHYRPLDVRNAAEVARTCAEIRREQGPIRGLIHGAGVLADRRIEDKTAEQFDLVYGTKVSGLRHLLNAAADDDLKLLAIFSSYTGRYGRVGQADYAAANEVLNKIAQSVSRQRPGCRVVSFNWGPWNGGMVSDGLRKIFASEGVGLIERGAGAEFFVREISAPSEGFVEVLALAPAPAGSAGFQPAAATATPPRRLETGAPTAEWNVAFERELNLASFPCLASHVLNGRAVLPAALMIELLAHGALHGNPGLAFLGFDDFKVLKGLVLEPGSSAHLSVLAEPGRMHDGQFRVPVQLVSRASSRPLLHARAEVLLADTLPAVPADFASLAIPTNGTGQHAIYGDGRLFHGAHFQGIERLQVCSEEQVAALVKPSPAPKQWIAQPLRPGWLADPLALDCSFQMLILWTWQQRSAASLPCAIRRYRQFVPAFPKRGCRVVIRMADATSPVVTADLHFLDREGHLLAVASGYECALDAGLGEAFQRNRLPHGA